jgi:hypothetical protein
MTEINQNLKEHLTCKICHKYFLNPVFLPCCNNICEEHVIKKTEDINSQSFNCDICQQNHQVPESGYSINRVLIDIMNIKLHFNETTKTASKQIDDLDSLNKEIDLITKDPHDFIYSYFAKEKNKIDLKRETLMSKISDISDEMIDQIKTMETDSKLILNEKQDITEFTKFDCKTLTEKVFAWKEEIRNPKLDESRLKEIIEESSNLQQENEIRTFQAKNKLLNKKGFYFIPNKEEFKNEFFGELIINDFSITHQRENSDSSPIKFDSNILNFNHSTELIRLCEFQDKKELKLLYRASRDGFSASQFHSKCDYIPKTLTIIKVKDQPHIFGGYTEATWEDLGYGEDPNAFIFSLVNNDNKPIKIKINKNNQKAIYCDSYFGPTFGGGHDFYISSDSNTKTSSCSYLGHTYQHPNYRFGSNEAQSFLAGSYNFSSSEIEVFQVL